MSKKRYFKLGAKAHTFVDPKSGVHITGKEVVEVDAKKCKGSNQLATALGGGHIKEVEEDEFNKYKASLVKPKAGEAPAATSTTVEETTDEDTDEDEEETEDEDTDEDEEEETEEEEEEEQPKRGRGRRK
jgi:hypothetical protein